MIPSGQCSRAPLDTCALLAPRDGVAAIRIPGSASFAALSNSSPPRASAPAATWSRHFEQVHSFFWQRFKTGIDPTRKARVILFRTEKEYEAYRPNEFAAAFYHPGEYHDFIVMNNSVNDSGRPRCMSSRT